MVKFNHQQIMNPSTSLVLLLHAQYHHDHHHHLHHDNDHDHDYLVGIRTPPTLLSLITPPIAVTRSRSRALLVLWSCKQDNCGPVNRIILVL